MVPRIGDIYAALPAITGKLELEYEGEMKGADHVVRELIRTAIAKTYDHYFNGANMQQIVQWFDLGRRDSAGATRLPHDECSQALRGIQGLLDKLVKVGVGPKETCRNTVSAAEFVLEGLHAHKASDATKSGFLPPERSSRSGAKALSNGTRIPYRQRRTFN